MNKGKGSGIAGLVIGGIAIVLLLSLRRSIPLLFKAAVWIAIIIGILMIAGAVLLVIAAVKSSNDEANAKAAGKAPVSDENAEILKRGRQALMRLRSISIKINNLNVRTKANTICNIMDKILVTLKEKPEKIGTARQFFNYYLPTLGEILTTYERVEKSGINITDTTDKVSKYLDDIKVSMDKVYENLYDNDLLDLSVEMEAMTLACKRDGLLTDTVSSGNGVNLTL